MKTVRYNRGLLLALAAAAGLTLTSCKDEPDKYEVADGTPTINYIRCLSTEIVGNNDAADTHYTNGELVTSASPQSLLCLVGENLRSVYEMYFNDQKAILNSSYITDNTLIVTIPRGIPQEVSDKIYMITESKDTIAYDFSVVIPAPSVNSMSCEYAEAGSTASIYGNYFIDDPNVPLTVTFPNGKQATDLQISGSYSTLSFTVPGVRGVGSHHRHQHLRLDHDKLLLQGHTRHAVRLRHTERRDGRRAGQPRLARPRHPD